MYCSLTQVFIIQNFPGFYFMQLVKDRLVGCFQVEQKSKISNSGWYHFGKTGHAPMSGETRVLFIKVSVASGAKMKRLFERRSVEANKGF